VQEESHLIDGFTLKMMATRPIKTAVPIYQSTLRHIPEDLNLKERRCDNLHFRMSVMLGVSEDS
jgi:hypothetical protein